METFVNENVLLLTWLALVLIGWGIFIWYIRRTHRHEDEVLGNFFKQKFDAIEHARIEGNTELYQKLLENAKTQTQMMRRLFS